MTDFILEKLKTDCSTPEYRWSALLNPPAATAKKKVTTKAKAEKAKTIKPKKKTEEKSKNAGAN